MYLFSTGVFNFSEDDWDLSWKMVNLWTNFVIYGYVDKKVYRRNIFKLLRRNRFQGIDSASLCSLAGQYDNPIPTRFLAPIDCYKIPAHYRREYGCKTGSPSFWEPVCPSYFRVNTDSVMFFFICRRFPPSDKIVISFNFGAAKNIFD